ncbi:MAG: beta-lactamase family protein [Planctomycetes bacterium]|nr:beta-lactamase family protein [Planctomycetota bacterium]
MIRRLACVSWATIVLALVAVSLPAQEASHEALRGQLGTMVDEARAAAGIPGLGAAVRTRDGTILDVGRGIADLENDVPVTERTVFRLASISKPITAVIALRLMERGVLDLDRNVSELVPRFPAREQAVTTRQLLAHLGGIRHYRGGEIASNRHYSSVADALAIFADDPLVADPGVRHHYSTYGYTPAGAAMVAAAGKEFGELLRSEIVEPAGCATLVVDDALRIVRHRAQGYVKRDGALGNAIPVDVTNKVPGGGLCGTPSDLVRFAGGLLDGVLLRSETLESAWTAQTTRDGAGTGYGLGFRVDELDGHRIVSHGGAQPKVSTMLWIDRDDRTVVALMANLEDAGRPLRELVIRLSAALR